MNPCLTAFMPAVPFVPCYANDNTAAIPELWAREGLRILDETSVMAGLVHRDFDSLVANFGDNVNARRPARFVSKRKADSDSVVNQDAVLANVQVPLDQHHYVTFTIKDGEGSLANADLIATHLVPAMQTVARGVDRSICGRIHSFNATGPTKRAGKLGQMDPTNAKDFVLDAREVLNRNNALMEGRNLVVGPSAETALLKTDIFIKANERGDGGRALENARLGRIHGFDTYMSQNVNDPNDNAMDKIAITTGAAYAASTTGSLSVTVSGYVMTSGEYVWLPGNAQPTHAIAVSAAAGNTVAVTLNEALKYGVANGAVGAVYKKCAVKGAFAAGYSKEVLVDGFTNPPQVGQLVSFGLGNGRYTYTVIESQDDGTGTGTQALLLDRPLQAALADNADAFPGPGGSMNWAFHRDALALVTRPLALPNQSLGVMSAVASYKDLSIRVSMQYDIKAQGTIVTCDLLSGVAVLDLNLCVPLLGSSF